MTVLMPSFRMEEFLWKLVGLHSAWKPVPSVHPFTPFHPSRWDATAVSCFQFSILQMKPRRHLNSGVSCSDFMEQVWGPQESQLFV